MGDPFDDTLSISNNKMEDQDDDTLSQEHFNNSFYKLDDSPSDREVKMTPYSEKVKERIINDATKTSIHDRENANDSDDVYRKIIYPERHDKRYDYVGGGIRCILTSPLPKGYDISFTLIDPINVPNIVAQHEELGGNILQIDVEKKQKKSTNHGTPRNNLPRDFQIESSICVQHVKSLRLGFTETVTKSMTPDGKFQWYKCSDIVVQDKELIQAIVTLSSHKTFVTVINRPRADHLDVDHTGGRLVSFVDPRVRLRIMKGIYDKHTRCELKVIPVDNSILSDIISQSPQFITLRGSSPIVCLHLQDPATKPMQMQIPAPSCRGRDVTQIAKLEAAHKTKADEQVYLVTMSNDGPWELRLDTQMMLSKEFISFILNDTKSTSFRFLLLRLKCDTAPEILCSMAEHIANYTSGHLMHCLCKQKADEVSEIHFECIHASKLKTSLQHLKDNSYTLGPPLSKPMFVKEGQIIEVDFKGNIMFENEKPLRMMYNSGLPTARKRRYVKDVDHSWISSKQYYYAEAVFSKLKLTRGVDQDKVRIARIHRKLNREEVDVTTWREEVDELCRLRVSLPKVDEDEIADDYEPPNLDEENIQQSFFTTLSQSLGDNWLHLADHLGVTAAQVDDFIKINSITADPDASAALDMLIAWSKTMMDSAKKIRDLYFGLVYIGRDDLADMIITQSKGGQYIFGGLEFEGILTRQTTVSSVDEVKDDVS